MMYLHKIDELQSVVIYLKVLLKLTYILQRCLQIFAHLP